MSLSKSYSSKYFVSNKIFKKENNYNENIENKDYLDAYSKRIKINSHNIDVPIFILKVQLKNNTTRLLKFYEKDDPKLIANNFAKENKCDNNKIIEIIKEIELNKNNYKINKEKINEVNNKSKLKEKTVTNNIKMNYGDKLYYKGIKLREESYTKNIKKQNINKNNFNNSFKPLINSKSSKMVKNRKIIEDQLLSSIIDKNEKIKKLKEIEEKKFKIQNTFNPKINYISKQIINNKKEYSTNSVFTNKFDELYNMNNILKEKKEINKINFHKSECPFEPTKFTNYENDKLKGEKFIDRVNKFQNEKDRKITILKNEEMYDQDTKKELFQPTIFRNGKERERPYEHRQVHQYLYSLNNLIIRKNEEESDNVLKEKKNLTQIKKVSNISDKIMKEKINEKLDEMFNYIDSNKDGRINKNDLKEELFDSNILELFAPLFDEIICRELILDKERFRESCQNLFDTYNIPVKNNILLNFGRQRSKKNYQKIEYNFKPNVKGYGKKYNKNIPVYEKLYNERGNHELFINDKKSELLKKELEECTFKPNIRRI